MRFLLLGVLSLPLMAAGKGSILAIFSHPDETTVGPLAAARSIRCHKTQWDQARMKDMDAMNRATLGGRSFLRLAMGDALSPAGRRETDLFAGDGQ